MATYHICFSRIQRGCVVVEAGDEKTAEKLAWERLPKLCEADAEWEDDPYTYEIDWVWAPEASFEEVA